MASVEISASGGVAEFRKSVYDDSGQTPTLNSIQVLQKNFNTYGGTQPPNWLTWTTSTESTNEGTNNNRVYLHIDFEVDTQHANVEDGSIYQIEIDVQNSAGNEIITFNYTNGIIDLNAIPGYKAHVSWQKVKEDGAADGDTITSIQDWVDSNLTWTATQNDLTFDNDNKRLTGPSSDGAQAQFEVNDKILSTTDGSKPYTVIFVNNNQNSSFNSSGTRLIQGSTQNGQVEFITQNASVDYVHYSPLGSNSAQSFGIGAGEISDMTSIIIRRVDMSVDGQIRPRNDNFTQGNLTTDNSSWYFEDENTKFKLINDDITPWLRELIVFEAELTDSQIRDITKWVASVYEETYYIE